MPPARRWARPGTVVVSGTATDVLGRAVPATARVTVDTFVSTTAGRAKTHVGGTPVLPATVVGAGRHGGSADLPVTWQSGAFDRPGVVAVDGVATLVDGSTLPATVRVQVTAPVPVPIGGLTAAASYTEPGYSTAGLTNGDTTDKAWSNWRGSAPNPRETLTVTLPAPGEATAAVVHLYRDNASGGGLPQSVQAGQPGPAGGCIASGDPVEVGPAGPVSVTLALPAGRTDAVCLILTAVPNGYLTVAEVELIGKGPGVSADATLAGILVDGRPLAGFDPAVTTYRVRVPHPDRTVVTAVAADPYAEVSAQRNGRRWLIKVTGEDGAITRAYRLELRR
jgi:hypothetical protein